MKAVVVEVKDRYMVAVDKKGYFHKLKLDKTKNIGEEIELINKATNKLIYIRRLTAVAAMLLLVLGLGYGAASYYSPYAYVDVDINPSVELVLNRYMRVLDIEKLNEDGDKVAPNALQFRNKKIEQAVEQLLENAKAEKLFVQGESNAVIYTVSGENEKSLINIKQNLKNITKKKLTKLIKEEDIFTEQVSLDEHDNAKKLKLSPGRIILFQKLKEVKPDAKIEDVQSMSVRETVKLTKEYRQIRKELKKEVNTENKSDKETTEIIEKYRQLKKGLKEDKKEEKGLNKQNKLKPDKETVNNDAGKIKDKKSFQKKGPDREKAKQGIKAGIQMQADRLNNNDSTLDSRTNNIDKGNKVNRGIRKQENQYTPRGSE